LANSIQERALGTALRSNTTIDGVTWKLSAIEPTHVGGYWRIVVANATDYTVVMGGTTDQRQIQLWDENMRRADFPMVPVLRDVDGDGTVELIIPDAIRYETFEKDRFAPAMRAYELVEREWHVDQEASRTLARQMASIYGEEPVYKAKSWRTPIGEFREGMTVFADNGTCKEPVAHPLPPEACYE